MNVATEPAQSTRPEAQFTGLGRITESRLGYGPNAPVDFRSWGARPIPAVCGNHWLDAYQPEPGRLSIGLGTHRQWYSHHFTACIIKGFCRHDLIADALKDEGLYPVAAYVDQDGPLAMASIWLNVIHDSVCGCYHEVVISFDVNRTRSDAVAFRTSSSKAPWALLYPNFGTSACDGQFLHSLYIDSPISISWGREMQSFAKHPQPTQTSISDGPATIGFDVAWGGQTILKGSVAKRFGLAGLMKESIGLLRTQPFGEVMGFLIKPAIETPMFQPRKTARQHNNGTNYLAHLWKGISPNAVQAWPWAETDTLDLGTITQATGVEDHNAHDLLRRADFKPVTVSYMPRLAAFIESAK